jgi:hypothetical protein
MKLQEITERVDKKELMHWLATAGMPLLREPSFFEKMGFDRCYVHQFLKKHKNVLKTGGEVKKNVKGISDTDFLIGLAEKLGIDTSKITLRGSNCIRMTEIAKLCMQVIAENDCMNNDNEYRTDDYAQVKTSISQLSVPASTGLSTFNYENSEVNSMSNVQMPNGDNYKLENKLRRFAMLPIIMLIVVAGIVGGTLAILILVKFFLFGLETYGLKFW